MHLVRSTRVRSVFVMSVLVALATTVAGCGEDADADALTRPEFVEQGNQLCAAGSQEIGQVVGELFGGEPTPERQQAALDQIVTVSRRLADDMGALAEPSDLTDDVDALVGALEAGTDAAEAQTGAEFFADDNDPWADAGAKATELGLDACAGEGG